MSEEAEGQEVAEVAQVEDQVEDQQAPEGPDPEIIAEARKYGWKPAEEFTLAPDGWVDADRFLELGSTKFKREKDRAAALERELTSVREQTGKIAKLAEKQVQRAIAEERAKLEKQYADLQREKYEAIEVADVDRVKEIEREQDQLRKTSPQEEAPQGRAPEVEDALKSVPWGSDATKIEVARRLINQHGATALPLADQIAFADRKMRDFYPDLYEAPKPKTLKVDGGGLATARTRGVDSLPAEARAAGAQFVKDGLFKSMAEYAAAYNEEN